MSRCVLVESAFLMRPTLIIAALVAASPAFAAHHCPQGQFYRASLDECDELQARRWRGHIVTL